MTTYRNDLNAAIARAEQLERELAASRAELEALRESAEEIATDTEITPVLVPSIDMRPDAARDTETAATGQSTGRDFLTTALVIVISAAGIAIAASARSWAGVGIMGGLAAVWTATGLFNNR
jgi:hypothetical protein